MVLGGCGVKRQCIEKFHDPILVAVSKRRDGVGLRERTAPVSSTRAPDWGCDVGRDISGNGVHRPPAAVGVTNSRLN